MCFRNSWTVVTVLVLTFGVSLVVFLWKVWFQSEFWKSGYGRSQGRSLLRGCVEKSLFFLIAAFSAQPATEKASSLWVKMHIPRSGVANSQHNAMPVNQAVSRHVNFTVVLVSSVLVWPSHVSPHGRHLLGHFSLPILLKRAHGHLEPEQRSLAQVCLKIDWWLSICQRLSILFGHRSVKNTVRRCTVYV